MDYNINIKQIEAGADFKVLGNFKDNKYKLEIYSVLNENTKNKMKNSQMTIGIILKSNEIKILKSTHTDYVLEDKKITITLNNFSLQDKHTIGIMFETLEKEFVEMVKISYRYMVIIKFKKQEILPTNMNAELYYYDKNNNISYLDIAKKCMVEIRFNL